MIYSNNETDSNKKTVITNDELQLIMARMDKTIAKAYNSDLLEEFRSALVMSGTQDDPIYNVILNYFLSDTSLLRYFSTFCALFIQLRMLTKSYLDFNINFIKHEYKVMWDIDIFSQMDRFVQNSMADYDNRTLDYSFVSSVHKLSQSIFDMDNLILNKETESFIKKSVYNRDEYITLHLLAFFITAYNSLYFVKVKEN